jgi:hypothetical protein
MHTLHVHHIVTHEHLTSEDNNRGITVTSTPLEQSHYEFYQDIHQVLKMHVHIAMIADIRDDKTKW